MSKSQKHKFSKKAKRRAELRILQALLAFLLGLALAGGVVLWQVGRDEARRTELHEDAESVIPEPDLPPSTKTIGGPFTLTNQDAKQVTDADFRGKYLLVYFGYTYCPDMCPTGLQAIAHILDQLGPDAANVQPLYITVDPARDTPSKLKEYVASFDPKIIGLTGTPPEIAQVAKEYQVYYAKGEQVDEHDYVMDHSSLIYLMGPDGRFIATFPENADPQEVIKMLKQAEAGQTPGPTPGPRATPGGEAPTPAH